MYVYIMANDFEGSVQYCRSSKSIPPDDMLEALCPEVRVLRVTLKSGLCESLQENGTWEEVEPIDE